MFLIPGLALLPILILVLVVILMVYMKHRRKVYKKEVVHKALLEIFDDFEYGFTDGFSKDRIYHTNLVKHGNRFKSDDYIKATYQGIQFEFADVSIRHQVQSGKQTITHTYFVGQWIMIKPHKRVEDALYVVDRNLRASMAQNASFFKENIPKVKMESIAFNHEFSVYTRNSHDAFYILNPHFIEKLIEIHRDDMSFYMDQSEIHVALYSGRDLLEPPFWGAFEFEKDTFKIEEAMQEALKYIELFR